MAIASPTAITHQDIAAMEARGIRREILHGQWADIDEASMASELHGAIATNLIVALGTYVKHHQLGWVYPGDTTYILEEDAQGVQLLRLPDVSVVSASRVKTQQRQTYDQQAPDLAIAMISPSERAVDIRAKLRDYLRTGVQQVWHVYPDTQEVVVHDAHGTVITYTADQTIPGDPVVPGLTLPVAAIFAA